MLIVTNMLRFCVAKGGPFLVSAVDPNLKLGSSKVGSVVAGVVFEMA